MDKGAAAQYLDKLFGTAQGHVAVAYKDKGESWQECQFTWPTERGKLLGWAEVHSDANVFICPALRGDAHTRKKGDGVSLRWLWADVDRDKIPADKLNEVDARISRLATLIVSSGTGGNAHVYVDLGESVDVATHLRLNTGLRDYLYADNKQSDNSLLRLPGTTNWKTPKGSAVAVRGGHGKRVTSTSLMKLTAFRTVSVMAMANSGPGTDDWALVDVSGLPRRVRSLSKMGTDEAVSRYGSRHKAVWAVTGELHKAGLDPDMIHTLMDQFPPGVEKHNEEHGAYDVHKDVDRRLNIDKAVGDATQTIVDEMDDEGFEEVSEGEVREQLIAEGVQRELLRMDIRDAAQMARAVSRHTEPPDDTSECLSDALSRPLDPVQWLIEGLASAQSNVIITGQYKTGKTALMVASLIPALVDGHDFLGVYQVHVPEEGVVVGHWNLEMSRNDLVDKYLRPVGIENVDNLKLAHWRGYSVNLLTEPGKDTAIKWLTDRQVKVWTIDSYAQLARMAGINSNDNDEVYALMGAIDEVKIRAGVDVCFLLGHTGRNSDDKASGGLNPTRGASAVDEHVDARWVLTKDNVDIRYLATEGRDVLSLKPTSLDFDETTKRMTMGSATKADTANDGLVQVVVAVLAALGPNEGLPQTKLIERMKARVQVGVEHCKEIIADSIDAGFVEIRHEANAGRGGRAAKMHYLVSATKPLDDPNRRATPAVVAIPNMKRGRRGGQPRAT